VSDNLAMAKEGSQYTDLATGFSLSWPMGGLREVVTLPEEERSVNVRRRIVEQQIVEVDLPATATAEDTTHPYRLLTGEEARKVKSEVAGPVIPTFEHFRYGDDAKAYYDQQWEDAEEQRRLATEQAPAPHTLVSKHEEHQRQNELDAKSTAAQARVEAAAEKQPAAELEADQASADDNAGDADDTEGASAEEAEQSASDEQPASAEGEGDADASGPKAPRGRRARS
jgi:hypothetical protein